MINVYAKSDISEKDLENFRNEMEIQRLAMYKDVTNQKLGIKNLEIFFKEENKKIYFLQTDIEKIILVKGKAFKKLLLVYDKEKELIVIELQGRYKLKINNMEIENKNKTVYINKKPLKYVSVLVEGKGNKITPGFINYWEKPIQSK